MRFTRAAGGAFENGFGSNRNFKNGRVTLRAVFVYVIVQAERDKAGVELFACVIRWTVLGASAAFHARIGLQGGEAGDIVSTHEAWIFVVVQCRDLAEARALEKESHRAEQHMQVLGVRNQREQDQDG
jgi:hypothetical protein